jgi:hypothetical protein
MGTPLFGMNVSGMIYGALKGKLVPMMLTKYAPGIRDPNNLAAAHPLTPTTYACEGFVDDKNLQGAGVGYQPTDNIIRKERQVSILGDSFKLAGASVTVIPLGETETAQGDRVTIGGVTYSIIRVKADPAQALYLCSVRA